MGLTLTVSNINKSYSGKPVLKDCSFSFEDSGTYVLMGPNGSGKSTFFRICALLEDPDKGEVTYLSGGTPLQRSLELRRRITLLLPRVGVFNASVFKNVAYGMKVRGSNGSEIHERVHDALEFVGLARTKGQNALTLSSGETQRLGIARAMVIQPEILFLDEPTASVDYQNVGIIEDILLKMKKEAKAILIVATHDMAQAKRLADQQLFLNDGRISLSGEAPFLFPCWLV
jgi:tungstate transport system ATP-binding protein